MSFDILSMLTRAGFVVSDWVAQMSGIDSANAGLDLAMPTSDYWDEDKLANAVNDGSLNKTRLVDMATRIIATWYQLGQDSPDMPELGVGMAPDLLKPHNFVDARDPASKDSLLQQAIEGHVLVKNVNNTLPLKKPRVLSVFGYDAIQHATYNPGAFDFTWNREVVTLQQNQLNSLAENKPIQGAPQTAMGTLVVGGGSGSATPAYLSSPYDALQDRAYNDDTMLFYDFASVEPSVVTSSDACFVFINEYSSEEFDRPGLADEDSDNLVSSVARQCNNTIVVIHNAGIRLVDAWADNTNVTAIIFAHLPGQDAGRAVVQLLYGDVSPSGRLPYTVAKQASDYSSLQGPCIDDSQSPQCYYDEGVNIDYRSFLANSITPRYEFGYGLTYTTFVGLRSVLDRTRLTCHRTTPHSISMSVRPPPTTRPASPLSIQMAPPTKTAIELMSQLVVFNHSSKAWAPSAQPSTTLATSSHRKSRSCIYRSQFRTTHAIPVRGRYVGSRKSPSVLGILHR